MRIFHVVLQWLFLQLYEHLRLLLVLVDFQHVMIAWVVYYKILQNAISILGLLLLQQGQLVEYLELILMRENCYRIIFRPEFRCLFIT